MICTICPIGIDVYNCLVYSKFGDSMEVAIQKITFAHFSSLKAGDSFKNYSHSRGVCGIVVPVSGSAVYTFSNGEEHT